MRCCSVTAAPAHIWSFSGVRSLVVVLGLIGGEGLVTAFVAASIRAVTRVPKEMTRELRTLLEVFG